MAPARPGPRARISTSALLHAIATRGRWWTAAFRHEDVTAVNEAVDRELLNGNLLDGHTLSSQGQRALAEHLGRPNDQGLIDLRIEHACRDHDPCWTIRCLRCEGTQAEHVTEADLEDQIQKIINAHLCLGAARPR